MPLDTQQIIIHLTNTTDENRLLLNVISRTNTKKPHSPASCFLNKSADCGSDINYNFNFERWSHKQTVQREKMAVPIVVVVVVVALLQPTGPNAGGIELSE